VDLDSTNHKLCFLLFLLFVLFLTTHINSLHFNLISLKKNQFQLIQVQFFNLFFHLN